MRHVFKQLPMWLDAHGVQRIVTVVARDLLVQPVSVPAPVQQLHQLAQAKQWHSRKVAGQVHLCRAKRPRLWFGILTGTADINISGVIILPPRVLLIHLEHNVLPKQLAHELGRRVAAPPAMDSLLECQVVPCSLDLSNRFDFVHTLLK